MKMSTQGPNFQKNKKEKRSLECHLDQTPLFADEQTKSQQGYI